jgi:sulfur carrier protein
MMGLIPFWGSIQILILAIEMSDNTGVEEGSIIEITVNGEPYRIAEESTVIDLVNALALAAERLAIELNLSILPRAAWDETKLKAGDRLEIVHFVGGGSIHTSKLQPDPIVRREPPDTSRRSTLQPQRLRRTLRSMSQ